MKHAVAWSLLLWTILLSLSAPARAKEKDDPDRATAEARIHLRAGILHFQNGKYSAAEEEMREAYRLRPVPDLQFNLAQCYERLDRIDDAISAYEAYLRGRPQAEDRDTVTRRLMVLRERQQHAPGREGMAPGSEGMAPGPEPGDAEPAPAPVTPPLGKVAPAEPPPTSVVWKTLVVYQDRPPPAGRGMRYAALGVAAAGLAALSSGIVGTVVYYQVDADVSSARELFGRENRVMSAIEVDALCQSSLLSGCQLLKATRDAQDATRLSAVIGYSLAGAAVLGTTALLLYGRHLDRRQERELRQRDSGSVTVAPAPLAMQGGGGLLLVGAF